MQDSRFVLSALRSAWLEWQALPDSAPFNTFRDYLISLGVDAFKAASSGQVKSTSGNNKHVAFETSVENGALTQREVISAWTYLVELYDRAVAELGLNQTDAVLEAKMETYLKPVTGYQDNWMFLPK